MDSITIISHQQLFDLVRYIYQPITDTLVDMAEQKQFLDVIDRDEAQRRFEAAVCFESNSSEVVPVAEALSRVLAGDVISRVNVPSFDRSNFDGYAVVAADTFGAKESNPVLLRLLGESIPTSIAPNCEINNGWAVGIATGAMLPRGADAVVLVEHTNLISNPTESSISISHSVSPGFGVAFAATDICVGQTVLREGDVLTSRETGVLSAIGETEVSVRRIPMVAIISTGDEIIPPGEPMRAAMVYDSNARIIADAVRELGCLPLELGIAVDDLEELRRLVHAGLEQADAVILSGGTSKGEGDLSYHVVAVFNDPGIVAHGVALKPGKPICLAATQGKPLVVLPGFPTSAIFTFHEFVAPVLRRLAGRVPESNLVVPATLAVKVNSVIGRTEYLLVGLIETSQGNKGTTVRAYPIGKGSGSVTTFSQADGFIKIDRHTEIVSEDASVDVQLIGTESRVADLTVIGSHCVGLDFLLSEMQRRGFRTKFFPVGSTGGLQAVCRGDCDLAGVHLFDEQSGTYNRTFASSGVALIDGYQRMQGIVLRKGETVPDLTAAEIVSKFAADEHRLMINRNQGSGTRQLIDRLLAGNQPRGYAVQASNHHAVAAAVAQGRADWGILIEKAAEHPELQFVPIEAERYDFLVPKHRLECRPVQAFIGLLSEPATIETLQQLKCLRTK